MLKGVVGVFVCESVCCDMSPIANRTIDLEPLKTRTLNRLDSQKATPKQGTPFIISSKAGTKGLND